MDRPECERPPLSFMGTTQATPTSHPEYVLRFVKRVNVSSYYIIRHFRFCKCLKVGLGWFVWFLF